MTVNCRNLGFLVVILQDHLNKTYKTKYENRKYKDQKTLKVF